MLQTHSFIRSHSQDPSMKLWMAIVMDGHRQGKKANAYKYPSRSSSDDQASSLKHSLSLQRQFHPGGGGSQSVPLLTNPASKLELPHVQIPLLEQFKTVPPPSTISNHLNKSIRVQILKSRPGSWLPTSFLFFCFSTQFLYHLSYISCTRRTPKGPK